MISEDGSPHGPKCFVLWNPPLTHMDAKKVLWLLFTCDLCLFNRH